MQFSVVGYGSVPCSRRGRWIDWRRDPCCRCTACRPRRHPRASHFRHLRFESTCRSGAASRRGRRPTGPSRSRMVRGMQHRSPVILQRSHFYFRSGSLLQTKADLLARSHFHFLDERPGGRSNEGEGRKRGHGERSGRRSRRISADRRPASWENERVDVGTSPSSAARAGCLSPGGRCLHFWRGQCSRDERRAGVWDGPACVRRDRCDATPRAESRGRSRRLRQSDHRERPREPLAARQTTRSTRPLRRTRQLAASHPPGSPRRLGPRGKDRRRCQCLISNVSCGRSRTRTGAGSELRPVGRLRGLMAGPKFPTCFSREGNHRSGRTDFLKHGGAGSPHEPPTFQIESPQWAIQDSNLGPLPYQRSALTI